MTRGHAWDEEFRRFVVSRSDALFRTAYLLCSDRGRAEDLLQTALWNAYRAWPRIRNELRQEQYVRRCLLNAYFSWYRRSSSSELPSEIPATPVSDHAEAFAEKDRLLGALNRLPARQRAVLVLRYYEDMTEAQVARVLRCSVGTVKSQAADALARLRIDPRLSSTGTESPHEGER